MKKIRKEKKDLKKIIKAKKHLIRHLEGIDCAIGHQKIDDTGEPLQDYVLKVRVFNNRSHTKFVPRSYDGFLIKKEYMNDAGF